MVEWQFQVVERQTQVAERRSGPFRLNLTTAVSLVNCNVQDSAKHSHHGSNPFRLIPFRLMPFCAGLGTETLTLTLNVTLTLSYVI